MERFTDKNMTESQVTEIVELMNGEHAEALSLWGKRNESQGEATGLIAGALITTIIGAAVYVTCKCVKATAGMGKAFVELIKEKLPDKPTE